MATAWRSLHCHTLLNALQFSGYPSGVAQGPPTYGDHQDFKRATDNGEGIRRDIPSEIFLKFRFTVVNFVKITIIFEADHNMHRCMKMLRLLAAIAASSDSGIQ